MLQVARPAVTRVLWMLTMWWCVPQLDAQPDGSTPSMDSASVSSSENAFNRSFGCVDLVTLMFVLISFIVFVGYLYARLLIMLATA